ncbi:MAG: hypothetical protein JWN86_1849 [Planctomycetota bacterium]|nr:hypothetical protein [Planctomycetota bacterium]
MATVAPPLTPDQVLAMPDDGVRRELIRGELREKPWKPHVRSHAFAVARVASQLEIWLDEQPEPRGEVVCGEAGFILGMDSGVGIDVAYLSAELSAATPESDAFIHGAPVLAVEILSPSDTIEDIEEKVDLYLESGVGVVWILSPRFRTVTVYRPGAEPVFYNALQELGDEPLLPGFRVAVVNLFSR